MKTAGKVMRAWWFMWVLISPGSAQQETAKRNPTDIRKLSQDFILPANDISPWTFYPKDNIKTLSTSEHRGLLTLRDNGREEDIRGVLQEPILIHEYPVPWEFQLGVSQPSQSGEPQSNYAIGVNLVVTYSDPSTWPKDKSQKPPDTHSLQLFVVHIGDYGEGYKTGIPQLKYGALTYGDPSPEAYLVYGRGDLAPNVLGDWRIPYIWLGYQPPEPGQFGAAAAWSWQKRGGPAQAGSLQDLRFRVRVLSPTKLEIGFGYGSEPGWRMRGIDASRFGKITGIWEIGPIVSQDRWIADDLAPQLGVHPTPDLKPPPSGTYYIDYAHFFSEAPETFEQFSDDFNIPGVPSDSKWFIQNDLMAETWSHPGYLTLTSTGKGDMALCPMLAGEMTAGLGFIELSKFKPPMEFELAFIAPDDSSPWNIWHSFGLTDEKGKLHDWWPGVQNIPGRGRTYINENPVNPFEVRQNPEINLVFEKPIPQSIMTHKPLRMLIQVMDPTHIRVGFRGGESRPWYFSKPFDTSKLFGNISKFTLPCFSSDILDGSGVGNYPRFEQFLIDYVHYRYGLSPGR